MAPFPKREDRECRKPPEFSGLSTFVHLSPSYSYGYFTILSSCSQAFYNKNSRQIAPSRTAQTLSGCNFCLHACSTLDNDLGWYSNDNQMLTFVKSHILWHIGKCTFSVALYMASCQCCPSSQSFPCLCRCNIQGEVHLCHCHGFIAHNTI